MYSDKKLFQVLVNHPVHLIDTYGKMSPTAFIPFCSFGGDMLVVGAENENYAYPLCNSFKPKVRNDQLCYETDLESLKDPDKIMKQLKHGLVLILDYNDERQMSKENDGKKYVKEYENVLFNPHDENSATIILDTVSKFKYYLLSNKYFTLDFRSCDFNWRGTIQS